MNILLLTSEVGNNAGGLAFHCNQLKEIFELCGHAVAVEVLLDPIEYCVLDGGYDANLGRKIRISKKLKSINEKYGKSVDVCISCGGGKTAYYAMLFCRANEVPLDVVLCGSEVNISCGSAEMSFYNAEAFKYATVIIGLSEELNNNARNMNTNLNCKYYTIPIYRDMKENALNDYVANAGSVKFIMGSSYLGEKKGVSVLLYAFSELIHRFNRNDMLYLAGNIDEDIKKQYIKIIEDNLISNNVVFLGYLSRADFINQMNTVDVYIQTSPFEGFGMSVVEALDAGLDIFITNTGYIAESIKQYFPDHIIYSDNPVDVADEINNFICNVYPKKEKFKIREHIQNELKSINIIKKWECVLNDSIQGGMINDCENCLSVMFHDVDSMYSGVDYAVEGFERLMNKLYKRGYHLCSARDYFNTDDKNNLIICTFDDGYENVYHKAFPIMNKYGFSATVFICPDLIGKNNLWNHRDEVNRVHMNDEMLRILVESGWEIGSHGLSHMNMIRLSEHELDRCLIESKKKLSTYGNIETYCYPYGMFNLFIKAKTKQYYTRAFSVDVGGSDYLKDLYQITRLTPEALIKELNLQ